MMMMNDEKIIRCVFIFAIILVPNVVDGVPPKLTQRIIKETRKLLTETPPGFKVEVAEDCATHFLVEMDGPKDSPYEGGVFKLDLTLPENYPLSPPNIKYLTKVYHPNVGKTGQICLDTLSSSGWTSVMTMSTALLSVQALLTQPYLGHFLSADIGEMFKKDEKKAKKEAKKWTELYAKPEPKNGSPSKSKDKASSSNRA